MSRLSRDDWLMDGEGRLVRAVHKELLCDCSGRYKKIFAGREKLERKGNSRSIFREEALSAVETDVFVKTYWLDVLVFPWADHHCVWFD